MSMTAESLGREQFARLIAHLTASIADRTLDESLENDLNGRFPAGEAIYRDIFDSCQRAMKAGWMCDREASGIRFGRVIKHSPATHGFSVDVVDMESMAGPHHSHPNGEIDLIMPVEPGAEFDGRGAGWLVYGAGSTHSPTVTGGRALVLYLLPGGAIEFTRR
jgi:Domain of unknown function (DUF4863)